jgi:hypothetical protein
MAKWKPDFDKSTSHLELEREIDFAANLAGHVLSAMVSKKEGLFPQRREPWYQPSDEDVAK